jgi:aminoglycoside 6'-N-acetyltransferase I
METHARTYFAHGTIAGLPHRVFIARDPRTLTPIGFAEVSLREYAEGCDSSPVGYLEGWCVEPHHQGRGIGRALVAACEGWAAERGCTEFASDAETDNEISIAAHEALGFSPVCRIVCFAKSIGSRSPNLSE